MGQQESGAERLQRLLLLLSVFLSGAAVMIYELTVVRFLQRYLGGYLDVWASEIAICLAGLALGYFLGGRMADRFHSIRVLGASIVAAGLFGLLIHPLAEWIGPRLVETDIAIAWHPLIAAGACSFLPLLALGAVQPQAIRLYVRSIETVGAAAGLIGALSTFGSIAGVLATGMYLLVRYGVMETIITTSIVLIVLGIVLMLQGWRASKAAALVCGMVLLPGIADARIIFEEYSAYHHILVEDRGGTRILRFDDDPESTMSITDPYEGGFEYCDFFHVPMVLDPTIDRSLFVGLGGGTGPKSFLRHYPNMQVDAAEIDPMVVEVAKKYFSLPDHERLSVSVTDGRAYLYRSRHKYGAIIMDAYSTGPRGGYIPYHLATREFFELTWKRLEHGGSVVYNVISSFGGGQTVHDIFTTMSEVFPRVYAFQAESSLNIVLVGMKLDPEQYREQVNDGTQQWPNGPWLKHPLSASGFRRLAGTLAEQGKPLPRVIPQRVTQISRLQYQPRRGRVLTDNHATVDVAPREQR